MVEFFPHMLREHTREFRIAAPDQRIYGLPKNEENPFSADLAAMEGERFKDTEITVTYWDNELVDAKTIHYAAKEIITSLPQMESYYKSVLAQYPVDEEIVFDVKLANAFPAPLELSPFSWRFYLLDGRGRRYKALSYDPSLDQPVNPQQIVQGKIYFSRIDPASGIDLAAQGVNGILEDIHGKTFHFSFR